MRKLMVLVFTAAVAATVLIGGCAKPEPASTAPVAAPPKMLDIGIATPLSGPQALGGTQMQDAVLLAVNDQNGEGGVSIGGQKYMLNAVIRDTKFDVVVSKSVAEELVFEKGIKVIAGPFIADTVGVQSITEPNKVKCSPP